MSRSFTALALLIAVLGLAQVGAVLPRRAAAPAPVDPFERFPSWERVTFNGISACTDETEVLTVIGSPICTATSIVFPGSGEQHAEMPASSGLRMECCTGGAGLEDDFLTDASDPWTFRTFLYFATGNNPPSAGSFINFANNTTLGNLVVRVNASLDVDVRNQDNARCFDGFSGGPMANDTIYYAWYDYVPGADDSRFCVSTDSFTDPAANCTPWCDGSGSGLIVDGVRMWNVSSGGDGWTDDYDWGWTNGAP